MRLLLESLYFCHCQPPTTMLDPLPWPLLQDGDFSFRLGKVSYSHHLALVRVQLFDNVRSKIPGKKSRRFCLGQVVLPLR